MNNGNTGPDISRADYFCDMMAAQRGFVTDEIAAELMNLSKKALENGERYLPADGGKRGDRSRARAPAEPGVGL